MSLELTYGFDSVAALVAPIESRVITGFRRIYFVDSEGGVDRSKGGLEISLDDETTWTFDCGRSGQELAITNSAWLDPFEGPLAPDNREFVSTSGKWTAFECSNDERYRQLIGAKIIWLTLITTLDKQVVGIQFESSRGTIQAESHGADDLFVTLPPG